MRNHLRTLTLILPALTLLALPLALPPMAVAQEAEPVAEFGSQVNVTEVQLDVLVHDKKGNIIIGLDPEDFIVEEDGEPVEVQDVTFYSNLRLAPGVSPVEGADVMETPQERYFILFFHDQRRIRAEVPGIAARQLEAARESKEWVRTELLPRDYVAVAGYDFKLKLFQDFTRDRGALLEAIDRAIKGKGGDNWPSRMEEDAETSLAQYLPTGKELRDQTKRIYQGLEVLARAAGHVPGRKNLMMFTMGFGDLDSFGAYRYDPRFYPPMVRTLNDNNVAVYGIDLAPIGLDHSLDESINQLSLETGGRYQFNFTSFSTPLREVSEANTGYYLLSYKAHHPADEEGYQKVTVRTKDPNFKVKAREGYLFGEG
jgi:VWFA-related protein